MPPGRFLRAILGGIAALALLVPALVVRYGPCVVPHARAVAAMPARRVASPAELPAVEPVGLADLTPDQARAYNAAVSFSAEPNPPARPFRLGEGAEDRARATDCLAAAAYYEAGDDPPGERAVAQVVLNRVRHPAFPKTVCGVVFQGAERKTGCQFTFTCDGSIDRYKPTPLSWAEARAIASEALRGAVFRPVGWATHYHTDYVVPYWQASLDKLVGVHTQLFYRWSGWWGTPPAFDRRAQPGEPVIAALAPLSDAHRAAIDWSDPLVDPAEPTAAGAVPPDLAAAAPAGWDPKPIAGEANSFLVTLPRGTDPGLYPALAVKACGDRAVCKFSAWADAKKTPATLPVEAAQIAGMTFSYLRDRAVGLDRMLWNCAQVKRADPKQCLKMQAFQPAPALPEPPAAATPAPGLDGVRRKAGAGEPLKPDAPRAP